MKKQGSRLTRTVEHQSKKQLTIFLTATFIIIIVLIALGPRILEFIGSFMISDQSVNENTEERITVIAPPHLSTLPKASKDGTLAIAGSVTGSTGEVDVYINGRKTASQEIKGSPTFEIKNIKLKEGENIVKARYTVDNRESEFTKEYSVFYSKEPPKIEVSFPTDGTEFKRGDQRIEVTGKTDNPNNTVTVNDFRAVVDEDSNFSYFITLQEGDNTLKIKAVNPAGVETIKEVKVAYRP